MNAHDILTKMSWRPIETAIGLGLLVFAASVVTSACNGSFVFESNPLIGTEETPKNEEPKE